MYLSKHKHVLSITIMAVAIVNILAELSNALAKILVTRADATHPDMTDANLWRIQLMVALIQFIVDAVIFFRAGQIIAKYRSLIPREDEEEMARLQKEVNPEGISVLTLKDISNLLALWAVILLGVRFVYEITSVAYKNFISQLLGSVSADNTQAYNTFVSMYNSSHGFKYVGMLIAITIGVATTGIFLKDRFLEGVAVVLMAAFLIAFLWVEQTTLVIGSHAISVVWTSVIFHVIETGGLFVMSLYLMKRYRGM